MTRPRIVRADTMDLQGQHAPSAKDHTRQPANPTGIAPHQEQALRQADQETKAEIMHGPSANDANSSDDRADGIDIYDDDDDDEIEDIDHHGDLTGEHEEGDLADGESDDMLDDDMMDKISSSPSIDDEDIDFEFVYALHNFYATVDGQANASKGDTMVLLDDSNSYWWLVRIVKDGSIGYLPAEHIETPTERLARLNKHRNVDLSATMLGDNSEKSKNPLMRAVRRRTTKNVQFAPPTYIEASDIEYSSDEDLDDAASFDEEDGTRAEADDAHDGQNDDIVVQPLRTKAQREKGGEEVGIDETEESAGSSPVKQRSSQELFEPEPDNNVSRSRNGTVRNTDSFFRDDTVETKKISLTPNLLRDEVGSGTLSSDASESRGSMENIDKTLSAIDKSKEDKKRRDKKSGMLSGLFKRKDKKTKSHEDDPDEAEKNSNEFSRSSPQPKTSLESVPSPVSPEARSPKQLVGQRQTTKLQKQPPVALSPTKQEFPREQEPAGIDRSIKSAMSSKTDQTIRQVTSEEADDIPSSPPLGPFDDSQEAIESTARVPSPAKKMAPSQPEPQNQTTSPVESHGDWQDASEGVYYPQQRSVASPPQRFEPRQLEYQSQRFESPGRESMEEPPVSPLAPGSGTDFSNPARHSIVSVSPPMSPVTSHRDSRGIDARSSFSVASAPTPTWSDASLRSYLDDDNDIRDLFIIVHDNSNIPPAGPDHPITGCLFKEESKRLREMNSQLDSMLAEWVGRRVRESTSK
ncbi:uncharacterized protein BP01DRAFT_80392 [Aspergillus saccharolyticus JOP 1030-1]|uniref:SH3 domain-containing protein n=1 Tax=Aspergillus saccharolyticus JOP 1030-1 TaxID=1450539 RepID=A0A318ZAG9_9EURO|nr:hypothetical protein BP01DRAFT_80392 [Aspergillus saccharolyticus JOP 1030-1]PYH44336.1 hypothetical protein BP01DRAFT_80392 [Aspergillus saccharolyticus JOP 1030-1]